MKGMAILHAMEESGWLYPPNDGKPRLRPTLGEGEVLEVRIDLEPTRLNGLDNPSLGEGVMNSLLRNTPRPLRSWLLVTEASQKHPPARLQNRGQARHDTDLKKRASFDRERRATKRYCILRILLLRISKIVSFVVYFVYFRRRDFQIGGSSWIGVKGSRTPGILFAGPAAILCAGITNTAPSGKA